MKLGTCLLASVVVAAVGTVALGGIATTAHDFRPATWYTSDQICLPCHTPHNAMTDGLDSMVLWNHEMTTATFNMYSPFAVDRPDHPDPPNQPGAPSKLCLSCHDGSIALDAYGGAAGDPANKITGSRNLGTDLRDDHPIAVKYPASDDGYATSPDDVKLVDIGGEDRVECTSCHDPHSDTFPSFLRADIGGSVLCLKCHIK